MHAANRAAPKILDALLLIGSAREDHIAFAMCGLSPDLQRNAREAANLLKPVANRLVSRRIATELRIEFRALRASTKFPDEVTCIDLSSPYNFPVGNGDLLRLLIEQCTPSRSMEGIRAQQGNGRNPSQYKLAILLAQVSHGWAAAVREWRQERCMFSMLAGEKATLTVDDDSDLARDRRRNDGTDGQLYRGDYLCASAFARLSGANTVELHLHGGYSHEVGRPLELLSHELLEVCGRCPLLERLLIRYSDDLTIATLVNIINACPRLHEIDAALSYMPGQSDDLFAAIVARPNLCVYVTAHDELYERSRVWEGSQSDQLREQVVGLRCEDATNLGRNRCVRCASRPSDALSVLFGLAPWQAQTSPPCVH